MMTTKKRLAALTAAGWTFDAKSSYDGAVLLEKGAIQLRGYDVEKLVTSAEGTEAARAAFKGPDEPAAGAAPELTDAERAALEHEGLFASAKAKLAAEHAAVPSDSGGVIVGAGSTVHTSPVVASAGTAA